MDEENKIISDETIVQFDLALDYGSMFELEKICKMFPQLLEKYTRMSAKAVKEVDRLEFELEVVTAELSEKLCKLYEAKEQKAYPPSAIDNVRRNFVPLCREWKMKKVALYNATETANIMKGAVKAIEARGFKLKEIWELEMKRLSGEKSGTYINNQ